MRLSENSNRLFKEFFDQCRLCEGFEFPDVNVFARRGAWLLTSILMVDGITLGANVFVHPKFTWRTPSDKLNIERKLMAHELAHVLQYKRLGFVRFLRDYIRDFWTIFSKKKKWSPRTWFESYLEIPHEIEARKLADEFIDWVDTPESGIS
ncbi:MAG: DUF4157 domain-containing protein [Pyrinomonadaceae bacterium]|nr:DUF4157 domain-containing protein [Pyrinomonadaceae bacterium]